MVLSTRTEGIQRKSVKCNRFIKIKLYLVYLTLTVCVEIIKNGTLP